MSIKKTNKPVKRVRPSRRTIPEGHVIIDAKGIPPKILQKVIHDINERMFFNKADFKKPVAGEHEEQDLKVVDRKATILEAFVQSTGVRILSLAELLDGLSKLTNKTLGQQLDKTESVSSRFESVGKELSELSTNGTCMANVIRTMGEIEFQLIEQLQDRLSLLSEFI